MRSDAHPVAAAVGPSEVDAMGAEASPEQPSEELDSWSGEASTGSQWGGESVGYAPADASTEGASDELGQASSVGDDSWADQDRAHGEYTDTDDTEQVLDGDDSVHSDVVRLVGDEPVDDSEPAVVVPADLETGASWEDSWRRSEPDTVELDATAEPEVADRSEDENDLRLTGTAAPPKGDQASDEGADGVDTFSGTVDTQSVDDDEPIELVGVGFDEEAGRPENEEFSAEREVAVDGSYEAGASLDTEAPESTIGLESDTAAENDDAASQAHDAPEPVAAEPESHESSEHEEPGDLEANEEAAVRAGFSAAPAPSVGEVELPPAPFGFSDPHDRARRLARALVSDIVVYHPDRRERSLRDGTLRQEFREEIRKSWDEYVANVGDQVARDTTYFRDALNDLLAGGSQLF